MTGNNLTEEILSVARDYNVTHLVVGKPLQGRVQEWLSGKAVVDKLIRHSGGMNIHVIQGVTEVKDEPKVKTKVTTTPILWRNYVAGLLMVATVPLRAGCGVIMLIPYMSLSCICYLYFYQQYGGKGPSYVTALCSVVLFDFYLLYPYSA